MHHTRPASLLLAITTTVTFAATAGGDDNDAAATAASAAPPHRTAEVASTAPADSTPTSGDAAEVAAFCDAALSLEIAPGPDIDFESASDEEITAAAITWATEVYRPLADDIVATAPDELTADVEVLSDAVEVIAETGDFGAFDTPAAAAASERYDQFAGDHCGWPTVSVVATEYAFAGLDDLAAGPTRIELVNNGDEVHEIALFRKNDGVTASAEELLALPDDEVFALVTQVGEDSLVVPPGATDSTVLVLEPGDYVAVCFVPVGLTDFESEPASDAPPHAAEGMITEFTVR